MKKILLTCLGRLPCLPGVRFLVRLTRPAFLVRFFIRFYFVGRLGVKVEEAEKPLSEYRSFLAFFTRRLKPEARPVERKKNVVVSPVDATIWNYGRLQKKQVLQAKGKPYSLGELVGTDWACSYADGAFVTLYLSPRDYHRIHHPIASRIVEARYFTGRLLPVNAYSLLHFERVFSKNKRLALKLQGELEGKTFELLSVWIGALNVGRLATLFDPTFYVTCQRAATANYSYKTYRELALAKGEEVGVFELGSTVILFFPSNLISWEAPVQRSAFFRWGESLARLK